MEDMAMNPNLDPFWRSSVGFDRIFDMMDSSLRFQPEENYPPYNIVRTSENAYRISLAVAGFKPDQISVTVQQNTLVVAGREAKKTTRSTSIVVSPRVTSNVVLASPTSSK
jgi:molecular chaperone IbpA